MSPGEYQCILHRQLLQNKYIIVVVGCGTRWCHRVHDVTKECYYLALFFSLNSTSKYLGFEGLGLRWEEKWFGPWYLSYSIAATLLDLALWKAWILMENTWMQCKTTWSVMCTTWRGQVIPLWTCEGHGRREFQKNNKPLSIVGLSNCPQRIIFWWMGWNGEGLNPNPTPQEPLLRFAWWNDMYNGGTHDGHNKQLRMW